MKRRLSLILLTLALAGCAASPSHAPAPEKVARDITEATLTPLADLNLVKPEIPPVLATARKRPYAPPQAPGCPGILAELAALEDVLDDDFDAPKKDDKPTLLERGAVAAEKAAVGLVRDTTEQVLPFRGWVRKLSGAERSSKEVASAISAGNFRRAFLKGMARGAHCGRLSPPASPEPAQETGVLRENAPPT